MHLPSAIAAFLLFSGLDVSVSAFSPHSDLGFGQLYRQKAAASALEGRVYGQVDRQLGHQRYRRQAPASSASASTPSTTASTGNGTTVDPVVWDAETATACDKAVAALNGQVLSASGITVCYNLPSLDNSTGAFQADLRVYRVVPPKGAWSDIADEDVTIGLSYIGASVSDGRAAALKKRHAHSPSLARRQDAGPALLQGIKFVGRLNESFLNTPMNLTQLVTLLAPNVTLSAVNADQQVITTTLTSKEASFVNGLFAGSPVGAASISLTRPPPFVLPGTTFDTLPIGLFVTVGWAVLGIGLMTWGTIGRYQYRQQYRRRKMRERVVAAKL